MSDQTPPTAGPFVVHNPDGSYTRFITFPCSNLPTLDQDSNTLAISKYITINDTNKTGCRIYIPKTITMTQTPEDNLKLPLIVYYRAGGFIFTTADTTLVHEFCLQLAAHLQAVVVNVAYRNAPEHRLPAAYDDGVEALYWVKSTQDPWVTKYADLSNCYLMGTSAGANLAYHAGLRVSQHVKDLEPLIIKGLILHNLFIGGVARTESEIRLANTGLLFTLPISDEMWDWGLPVGATRDHEYCNLMMGRDMGRIKDVGWPVMFAIRNGDLGVDRQTELAKTLESKGVACTCFYSDGEHGIEYFDKSKAKELFDEVSSFMSSINVKKHEMLTGNDTKSIVISDK